MELTRGRVVTFPAGRDDRNTDGSISPVKVSPLFVQGYNDPWFAPGSYIVPIGNFIAMFAGVLLKWPRRGKRIYCRLPVRGATG
jgi:hypothetical protein